MKLIGLISPNLSEDTLIDVYEIFPPDIRIEGRTLKSVNTPTTNFIAPSWPSRISYAIWRARRSTSS